VRIAKKEEKTESIKQFHCVVPLRQRLEALCRFIDVNPNFNGFIFCRTKALTAELAEQLSRFGYPAKALHGDMNQNQRNAVIKDFKNKHFPILAATDVAARGIDIDSLTHVINYNFPEDYEGYIHRIGRTGRAGKEGIAITFVSPSELRHISRLEKMYKTHIKRIDIPSAADIAHIHMQKVTDFVQTIAEKNSDSPYHKQLQEMISSLDKDVVAKTAVHVLYDKFFKNLKNIQTVMVKNDTKEYHGDSAPGQELKLFIGSNKGITKKDLLSFIVQHANIQPATITKIKVTNSLSFIKVPHEAVNSVVKCIQGKNLKGNKVRLQVV
jgi:ATP-dependent RNA helicase DeaD